MKKFFFVMLLLFNTTFSSEVSNWHIGIGALTNKETTLNIASNIRYTSVLFQAEGVLYSKSKYNRFLNCRGTLAYRFFESIPYNIDLGISLGYLYARAENNFFKSVNEANGAHILNNFNEREYMDFSFSLGVNLYGLKAMFLIPFAYANNNVRPRVLWTFGYIFEY